MIIAMVLLALSIEAQASSPTLHQQSHQSTQADATKTQTFDEIAAAAKTAWEEHRDNDAIRLSRQGLKQRPDWDTGLWYLGSIFYEQDNYREARGELRHYLVRNPKRGVGWALIGLCDYKLREYVHAEEDLQRALALGLEGRLELQGPVYYYSALLLNREERFEESAAYLYHLRRKDGGLHVSVPLEIPMGLNALKCALLPEEVPANRVELARQTGEAVFARFEERRDVAKSVFVQLLKQYPDEEGLHYQYGLILLADHAPEGVNQMERAMELSPSDSAPHISLAQYYQDVEQNDKATAQVGEALALDPDSVPAHLLKGQLLTATGDTSAGITELESTRTMSHGDSQVLWALMRAYHKAGRNEEAQQIVKELGKLGEGRQPESKLAPDSMPYPQK